MTTRVSSIIGSLGAFGWVVAYLFFVLGTLAIFFAALNILAAIANVVSGTCLFLLPPLFAVALFSGRARRFCGNSTILISYLLGASTWLTATVYLNDIWGKVAVIAGVFIFGVGSIPLAFLALLLHGKFGVFFLLLGQLVTVYVLRALGLWIESKATARPIDCAQSSPTSDYSDYIDGSSPLHLNQRDDEETPGGGGANYWLEKGRSFYDLADEKEWNPAAAVACFEKGIRATPDNSELQVYLGMIYADGDGVQQDYRKAFEHFSIGASLGDPNAQRSLGEMYENAQGVPHDLARAAFWYEAAAKQGDTFAEQALRRLT